MTMNLQSALQHLEEKLQCPTYDMGYNVLSIAYPLTSVGPDAVGGSEQILTLLDGALTKAGHRSIVIAAAGSRVRGTLIPSPKANGCLDDRLRRSGQQAHRELIAETLERFSVDLIHMHSLDFHSYMPDSTIPVLATLHLPPDWYPRWIFRHKRAHFHLNCVSSSQQRSCPSSSSLLPYIPNGVDVHRFDRKSAKQNYVLALGRICPEKGFHFALQAARMARRDLILAGEVFPYAAHQRYFKSKIAPLIDNRRRYIGPVGFARKRTLLAQARCVLITSTVAETSSLVAMEALAAGTPVVAFGSGALPEIIEHGRNGFLVRDVEEMAEAIERAGDLDPEACRYAARSRFSADHMIQRYFGVYEQIIAKAKDPWADRRSSRVSWLVA
jgi:glycosyltransferase involved in cell wall biosynthesis